MVHDFVDRILLRRLLGDVHRGLCLLSRLVIAGHVQFGLNFIPRGWG